MSTQAHNKEPVWFYPRDSKEDGVCYYLRDWRKMKHERIEPLTPHPLASSNGAFADMVFLHREPVATRAGNDEAMVKDWYGPKQLVDDLLSVQEVGGGFRTGLLYARGTEAPQGNEIIPNAPLDDTRVPLTDIFVSTKTLDWAWTINPKTGANEDMITLTVQGVDYFTGDESYIDITDLGDLTDIPGMTPGIYRIERHIRNDVSGTLQNNQIQINMPYTPAIAPGSVTGDLYEAQYLLDGYTDSEDAPGVLKDLFHLRSFSYRLSYPSITHSWDETLGLQLTTENRLVPKPWMRLWDANFSLAAYSTPDEAVGYQPQSRLIVNRQKKGVIGPPENDGLEWNGKTAINVPRILTDFYLPWSEAWAKEESHLSYDAAITANATYWGPADCPVNTRTRRRIVLEADVNQTILDEKALWEAANPGKTWEKFTFKPQDYHLAYGYWYWWLADNKFARAGVWKFVIQPCLLKDGATMLFGPHSVPGYLGTPWLTGTVDSHEVIAGNSYTQLTHDNPVPWGDEVLWDLQVKQARYDYWIIDAVYVTLPANPATSTARPDVAAVISP